MPHSAYQLRHPDFFDFTDRSNAACRGADQEWFTDPWQRRAGCGPTTAATILSYLAYVHPDLAPMASEYAHSATDFVFYMEEVWKSVTPTSRGLHSLALFSEGSLAFAKRRGVFLSSSELHIEGFYSRKRPSFAQCRQFIENALSDDLPLAFLNFSNGALSNLDSWHWVPLIKAEAIAGHLFCIILDEGFEKQIDFSLWHETTRFGGGLVALTPRPK